MASHTKRRKLSDSKFEAVNHTEPLPSSTKSEKTKDQRGSLFVRSLPASVTTERLAEHFSNVFPIKHAVVIVDPTTKVSKQFGFVTFTDAEDAQAAADQLNNSTLDGRKIKVEIAESRHRDREEGAKKAVNTTGEKLRSQRETQKQDAQTPRLIVRNLPWSIKEPDDLSKLFLSYGKVKHAIIPKKNAKTQYGFGIVILRGKKNAEKALAGLNGKEVDGRVLAVDWAVDRATWEGVQKIEMKGEATAPKQESEDEIELNGEAEAEQAIVSNGDVESDVASLAGLSEDRDLLNDTEDGGVETANDIEASSASEDDEPSQNDTTVFIRNLQYEVDDDALKDHFRSFGPVRYARVVYDQETERSRGTGFVCFFNESDAKACVKEAPKKDTVDEVDAGGRKRSDLKSQSILQNEAEDPSGRYTLEGRVLQVSRALPKSDADRRASEASDKRSKRDGDKRRLYLLSEGTISKSSKLYEKLGKAEIDLREASAKQRQKQIKTNPNLGLSLTRLSVRNIPRHVAGRELKALAREAVVGFMTDVQKGIREPLSKEEQKRGEEEMREAERLRKERGVGIVKQSKVVFEGKEGNKVQEGTGRSRGYGFLEYHTHRNALAGLRWLNGYSVKPKDGSGEKPKRLIVEFAIENAQVVQRRTEREKNVIEKGPKKHRFENGDRPVKGSKGQKRKRAEGDQGVQPVVEEKPVDSEEKNRLAKRNRIISKKRNARKVRKG